VGCEDGVTTPPAPSPGELSTTFVPNLPLDVYLYGKQNSPTTIPAKMLDASQDVKVESFAIWGVPADGDFAFGGAFTMTDSAAAAAVFDKMDVEEYGWKKLYGSTVFLVIGSGPAAKSLQTAISNNDFKYYDDSEALQAVALLPSGYTTRLATVAIAKPSDALMGFITESLDTGGSEFISTVLKLANLKIVAGGIYSPRQVDIAAMAEIIDGGGDISGLDLGVLFLVKSGYPGLVVEPAVKKILTENEFTEINVNGLILYRGSREIDSGQEVTILVRIEGNHIFVALSGQESYAETLITSVQVE